jgi:hypothetical protein
MAIAFARQYLKETETQLDQKRRCLADAVSPSHEEGAVELALLAHVPQTASRPRSQIPKEAGLDREVGPRGGARPYGLSTGAPKRRH